MLELYCPSIFTRTPAFERVVLVWKFQTDKLCAVWLSKLFNQFIGGNKLMLQCCKTVCPISLFICVILFKRWRIFSLLFKHGALLPTSDGNASLRVYEYDNCHCLEKSVIFRLHSQVFSVVSCTKSFDVCHWEEYRGTANNLWRGNS